MYYNGQINNDDRVFPFAVPFLFGALAGGAAVGITRPRPVYVTGGYYGAPYQPYGPVYYSNSYQYYQPPFRPY